MGDAVAQPHFVGLNSGRILHTLVLFTGNLVRSSRSPTWYFPKVKSTDLAKTLKLKRAALQGGPKQDPGCEEAPAISGLSQAAAFPARFCPSLFQSCPCSVKFSFLKGGLEEMGPLTCGCHSIVRMAGFTNSPTFQGA